MRQVNHVWTDTNIETLKDLWSKGETATEIANKIGAGLSRNAIIGKAHRLRLVRRENPVPS